MNTTRGSRLQPRHQFGLGAGALAPEENASIHVRPLQVLKIQDFNPFRMNTYASPKPVLKTRDFKSCRFNTYEIICPNPIRMNTYEKTGVGEGPFPVHLHVGKGLTP